MRREAAARDAADPLAGRRDLFAVPPGIVYLDGNSLGVMPKAVPARVARTVETEWGEGLIRSWNSAGWIDLPARVGAKIGRLIGAEPGSVTAADSTSVNLFKVLSAALRLRPGRTRILSDRGNFPTDLYMAQGLIRLLGDRHRLDVVAPEAVADAIGDDLAVLMLTEVDYRTGRRHDMPALTARAQAAGALTIWDLAHSAGAFPVDLAGAGADFAIGCGYKYLNGGPGAPAFAYVAPRHQEAVEPALSGWMGHAAPFAFDLDYRPAAGIDRLRAGTPSVIGLSALDAALDVFEGVDLAVLAAKSASLAALFVAAVAATCPDLVLASPRDPAVRGSQISFRTPEGYAVMQALIARGVIGDFRAPDIIRFGFTPLYLSHGEVLDAAATLAAIMSDRLWDRPEFKVRAKVT
ncbi:kynureninase [Prosthecomicrobium sp. N25]|uniref:kynureninase n=1 Tax=Prosthecomicrobium sp. N25 TaxID=3129254 RepID=UPI003076D7FC